MMGTRLKSVLLFCVVFYVTLFTRECFAQEKFTCNTLTPIVSGTLPPEDSSYIAFITFDALGSSYYHAGSSVHVVVTAPNGRTFRDIILQARIVGSTSSAAVGTWSNYSPSGISGRVCGVRIDSVISSTVDQKSVARATWVAPTDSSLSNGERIYFIATLVYDDINPWGWTTTLSAALSEPCKPTPCANNATCLYGSTDPGYFCHCKEGFTGQHCTEATCVPDFCFNGGRCFINSGGQAQCICSSTYSGTRCENHRDVCSSNQCLNGGTCSPSVDNPLIYECECPPTHTGNNCQTLTISPCDVSPCENGGNCVVSTDQQSYTCQCVGAYTGTNCETNTLAFCYNNPCLNGATCNPIGSGGQCACSLGYTGSFCETSVPSFCDLSPCQNGATCLPISTEGGQCVCADGFTGSYCEQREQPADPCSINPCLNGGTCFRQQGGSQTTCTCPIGYSGTNCATFTETCSETTCMNGGTCLMSNQGTIFCQCEQNYKGDRCETFKETCSASTCLNGGTCSLSTQGTIFCQCMLNFEGNRCQTYNDPCLREDNQPVCMNGGVCYVSAGQVTCTCTDSWVGPTCESPSPCFPSNPCLNSGDCSYDALATGKYSCNCQTGFVGNNCETNIACSSFPCRFEGTCSTNGQGGYTCTCKTNHYGQNCEGYNNPCGGVNCNNGYCSPLEPLTGYRCMCGNGYTGTHCDQISDICIVDNPCMNDGVCAKSQTDPGFTCECTDGYFGETCEYSEGGAPVFRSCPHEGVISFGITSGNSTYVDTDISAIDEDNNSVETTITPSIVLPGVVEYKPEYISGRKFVVIARDRFDRVSMCNFTIVLIDQVKPTITCPKDFQITSNEDVVQLTTQSGITLAVANDNVALREENPIEYTPSSIKSDGEPHSIVAVAYDTSGNAVESTCEFRVTVHKQATCRAIEADGGSVSCDLNENDNHVCTVSCNEGYVSTSPFVTFTCADDLWSPRPLRTLCTEPVIPNSISKSMELGYLVEQCDDNRSQFRQSVQTVFHAKLEEYDLCEVGSAKACKSEGLNILCSSSSFQNEIDLKKRKRRQADEQLNIQISISAIVDSSLDDAANDVTRLTMDIQVAAESGLLNLEGLNGAGDASYNNYTEPRIGNITYGCSNGYISSEFGCVICVAGTYHNKTTGTCEYCPVATYQHQDGRTSCNECESGETTSSTGTYYKSDCQEMSTGGLSAFDINIIIYICGGVGVLLLSIIVVLILCIACHSSKESKYKEREDLNHLKYLNHAYLDDEIDTEMQFRERQNTTASALTYQTVPEGDGNLNIGDGVTNGGLVRIPTEELYADSLAMQDRLNGHAVIGADTPAYSNQNSISTISNSNNSNNSRNWDSVHDRHHLSI